MIRIRYSDDSAIAYPSKFIAKYWVLDRLFTTNGRVFPVQAIEVLDTAVDGVSVERDLKINFGVIEFE